MPAVSKSSLVLVTGATGYIAVWVVKQLLEAGYRVRGTARSASKGAYLEKLFSKEKSEGKFEIVIVEDIGVKNAFDDAVKGVDAIAHTASPFHLNADDPQELIVPAVQGTVGVLQSALEYSPTTKRIIILSSCASVWNQPTPEGIVLSEKDWNEGAIKEVEEKGKEAAQISKYRASKTLAEKAAWAFHAEHKSKVSWDLVALNPPYVFGPTLHEISGPSSLNTSVADFFKIFSTPNAGGKTEAQLLQGGMSWVDVRDLADAHVRSFQKEEAGGERVIISAGAFTWQDWLDAAHSLSPAPSKKLEKATKGTPGKGKESKHLLRYDASKSASLLGFNKYHTLEETARNSIEDFEKRGWL